MSPEPSLSRILNTISRSSLAISMAVSEFAKYWSLSYPLRSSSRVKQPLLSSSINWHMRMSSACALSCCCSFSFTFCLTTNALSLSWACCAFSTTTAKIKLITSKLIVTNTSMKNTMVSGASSTMGNVTWPQESPAMIVWMMVMLASHTFRYACSQREQLYQYTLFAMGWISCTATSAKTMRTPRSRTRPQQTVRTVPDKPMTITCSSGKRPMTW
mmetsp:Transcript_8939/g.18320  ORF Transcript_8939/g.18320 Transcript_8939/m.18320 type:complete len:215 (+) Transcript_8939:86-730(+)